MLAVDAGMDGAVIVVSTHQNELRSFQMTDTCRDMFVDYQYQSLVRLSLTLACLSSSLLAFRQGLGENDLTLPPGETLYPVVLFGNKVRSHLCSFVVHSWLPCLALFLRATSSSSSPRPPLFLTMRSARI